MEIIVFESSVRISQADYSPLGLFVIFVFDFEWVASILTFNSLDFVVSSGQRAKENNKKCFSYKN